MNQTRFMISDAAKQVSVEAHVLRYWEEELKLPIGRNELGQRYYTEEDIGKFKRIKEMKDSGFQLKAIRMVLNSKGTLSDGKTALFAGSPGGGGLRDGAPGDAREERPFNEAEADMAETVTVGVSMAGADPAEAGMTRETGVEARRTGSAAGAAREPAEENRSAQNAAKLTMLLKKMLLEVLEENNKSLIRSVEDTMGDRVIKEMNYLFREQEEREEERFRDFDEALRNRQKKKRQSSPARKGRRFFQKKKSLPG